jgi:hypothetical protein
VRKRGVAIAVHADHLGRDALAHLRLVSGIGQDHQAAVRMQVDEAGRDDQACGVDGPRRRWPPGRVSLVQAAIQDAHRAGTRRRAGPVDQGPAGEQQLNAFW